MPGIGVVEDASVHEFLLASISGGSTDMREVGDGQAIVTAVVWCVVTLVVVRALLWRSTDHRVRTTATICAVALLASGMAAILAEQQSAERYAALTVEFMFAGAYLGAQSVRTSRKRATAPAPTPSS